MAGSSLPSVVGAVAAAIAKLIRTFIVRFHAAVWAQDRAANIAGVQVIVVPTVAAAAGPVFVVGG